MGRPKVKATRRCKRRKEEFRISEFLSFRSWVGAFRPIKLHHFGAELRSPKRDTQSCTKMVQNQGAKRPIFMSQKGELSNVECAST